MLYASMPKKTKGAFIEPMLLLRTDKLPEGPEWLIELKLDGYRALAIKSGGEVQLRSRNNHDFNSRYPGLVKALASMPDETVIDGQGAAYVFVRSAGVWTQQQELTALDGAVFDLFGSSVSVSGDTAVIGVYNL